MPSNSAPITISEVAKGELTDFLERSARKGVSDIAQLVTDAPGFIASDDATNVPFRLGRAVARSACRRWARGQGLPSTPVFDSAWGSLCGPYLDSIGETPGDGSIGNPFPGGQCPGVFYTVVYQVRQAPNNSGPFSSNISLSVVGPVRVGKASATDPNCTSPTLRFSHNAAIINGLGQNVRTLALGCSQFPDAWRIVSVTRSDGQPDNCGPPLPIYDPPNIPPGLPPVGPTPVRLPGIGDVDVDVSFNPDGSINVSLPDLGIDLDVPNPFAPAGGGGDGPGPGEQGQPGDAVDVGPGDAADETDPERNLVGVLVQIVETPPRANRTFNQTESYTKGPYYVYFGGGAGLSLNPEGAIARQDQFYYAPPGANRFRVVPNAGFTLRVTPYYQED